MGGLILRTSLMVGFPGETEDDFRELLDFVEETRFERLGAFVFSPEEGTPAWGFDGGVRPELAAERHGRIRRATATDADGAKACHDVVETVWETV